MDKNRCTGWWEQAQFGRHEMDGLMVTIEDNQITGSGYDIIGMFSLDGTLDDQNNVQMIKHYLGAHRVLYKGFYNGNDRLWGVWTMMVDSGPWEILFRHSASERATEKKIETVRL